MKLPSSVVLLSPPSFRNTSNSAAILARAWGGALAGLVCCFTALQTCSADCVSVPAGLVSCWQGEGNAQDQAESNDGNLQGDLAFVPGEVGQAFRFNGTNADVRVPASASLNVGLADGFTIETWINPADVLQWHPLVEWNNGSFGVSFAISDGSGAGHGALWASVKDTAFTEHPLTTPTGLLVSNVWQHVAVTYAKTNGYAVLYINGVQKAQATLGVFTPRTIGDLYLGLRPYDGGAGARFVGLMDEVSIYNRALSGAEIAAIYSAGTAGKCFEPWIKSQPRNQIGYWGMSASFGVAAEGTAPLSYQWRKDNVPINGATDASLVLTNLQMGDAGKYSVVVTNIAGSITSSNASLIMNPAGVSLALYSGITISGVVGLTYGVQYSTDLSNTNGWRGIANVALGVPTQLWFDVQPASQPQRYYRIVPGPIPIP
jgi:hypothetical protein